VRISHKQYLLILAVLFFIYWAVLAINPYNREAWMLENVFVLFGVIFIAATYGKLPLSRISYTLVFIFLCLHVLGTHYTYSRTPYDEWFRFIFGFSIDETIGFERNHYDRIIHFAYGLLISYPLRELFIRIAMVKGFWGYFFPLVITISSSAIYEMVEWGAAEIFGGDLGIAFLGTQGDIWDAQKDMAFASLGALLAMLFTALININLQRDFAREWNDSLKVKGKRPLGEDEILRMWKTRNNRNSK
jgi:putative membrane protein